MMLGKPARSYVARQSERDELMAALRKYGRKGHKGLQLELALEEAIASEATAAAAVAAADGLLR